MRKILFFMLLLVQLTAATAFAYTNKEDGFKHKVRPLLIT